MASIWWWGKDLEGVTVSLIAVLLLFTDLTCIPLKAFLVEVSGRVNVTQLQDLYYT